MASAAHLRALSTCLRADDPATMDHPSREDFFLERRRVIVRALGPETKRQGRGRSMSRKRAKKLVRATTRSVGPIDKYFGDRLRARRIMMKRSQGDLGKSLGLTFQQIQKYEKGTNRIGSGRLFKIAEVLQCDVTEFYDSVRNNPTIVSTPFSRFMATNEGVAIIEAMVKIKSQALRRAVIDIAEKLAET
jgi:transcriptional regulator with XRE-family HTH domain